MLQQSKFIKLLLITLIFLQAGTQTYAQQKIGYPLPMDQALQMALNNHQQLKISQAEIAISRSQEEVTKLQRTPTASFSANAFYLGDALVLDKDLTKVQTIEMPHFGNTFALQASQLLYKGGAIGKSIELAELQTQLAELDLENDTQAIKFLVISNYLDIIRAINQLEVLERNKVLAEQRQGNIKTQYEQGMITRNEVIRGELQIKNLEQSILTAKNNYAILSNQLGIAIGITEEVLIIPENIAMTFPMKTLPQYKELAYSSHPGIRSAKHQIGIAEKNIDLVQTDKIPAISAFGGYNMQRPLTTSTPVMDMYTNTFQAGISLSYNIDNLFRTKKRVHVAENQSWVAREALELTRQNIELGLNTAFIKYNEAVKQEKLMEESKQLANENYKIIEAKYLNQLVITAEMTDATNAKLEAELQHANAKISVAFQYYNLIKATGNL